MNDERERLEKEVVEAEANYDFCIDVNFIGTLHGYNMASFRRREARNTLAAHDARKTKETQ